MTAPTVKAPRFKLLTNKKVTFTLNHGAWVEIELTDKALNIKTFYKDENEEAQQIGRERITFTEFQGGHLSKETDMILGVSKFNKGGKK